MSAARRNPTPETIRCRACAELFHWDGRSMRRPHYCPTAACKRARQNDRAYAYFVAHRRKADTPSTRPWGVPPLPTAQWTSPRESPDRVDRLLAAATARRKAEERATGQRRYTITDGWQQREAVTFNEPNDGWGW